MTASANPAKHVSCPRTWRQVWQRAAVVGFVVVVFAYGARKFVQPLHARGYLQPTTAVVDSIAAVIEQPAREITFRFLPDSLQRYRFKAAVLLSFILYASLAAGWMSLGNIRFRRSREIQGDMHDGSSNPADSTPGPSSSRRTLLRKGVEFAAVGGLVGAFAYVSLIEPRMLQVRRLRFPLRGLPRELDGFRIVQISDVHHGPWLSLADLHRVVATANALRPDLIVLTGDYVLHDRVYAAPAVAALSDLRAPVGVVATLGNHDWYESADLLRDLFPRTGIPMLDNTRLFVRPDRTLAREADGGLCIAGVGDYWRDRQFYDAALGGVSDAMPRILLSHNPDVAEDSKFIASGHRVDLMVSGHTHGGQIRLPGVPALVTYSHYGQKYLCGLARGPVCPVYTSAGVGMSKMPVRIGVPPEITEIQLSARSDTL